MTIMVVWYFLIQHNYYIEALLIVGGAKWTNTFSGGREIVLKIYYLITNQIIVSAKKVITVNRKPELELICRTFNTHTRS